MRLAVIGYPLLAKRQWRLCSRFETAGVDTHIIVPDDWPPIPSADHPPADASFTIHWSQSLFHGKMAQYVFSRLRQHLSRIDPDIVVTHGEAWFLGTVYTQAVTEIAGIPHVVFSWENLEKVPQSRLQRVLERLMLTRADGFIVGSDDAASRIRSRGFKGPIVETPQSGVDTNQFAPATGKKSDGGSNDTTEQLPSALETTADEQIILYAGRLDSEKGIETLLETVPTVRESIPSVRYVLLGEGELETDLRTIINAEGLSAEVDLITERQPYDLMPVIYRTADTFVYPSETTDSWAEQFGYSVAEAMSCGVVPIVSDCGSLPWVVDDAGVVVPERDSEALANGMINLLENDKQRRELSVVARERIVTQFGLNPVAESQLSFLADLAGEAEPSIPESG